MKTNCTKEFLIQEYQINFRSIKDIANEVGLSFDSVYKKLIKYGLYDNNCYRHIMCKKFGCLQIIQKVESTKRGRVRFKCKCDCGNETIVFAANLIKGHTKSCGCLRKGTSWHNKYIGDLSGTYWLGVKRGAKSRNLELTITQQEAWDLFLKQCGKCALTGIDLHHKKYIGLVNKRGVYSDGNASLDRIDSSKGYTLDNCQWIDKRIQKMKMNLPENEFINLCRKIVDHANKSI